ncbi:hypothetical protein [Tenacibaculum salmonis]|uniref:hypothetical protein n=1 Tax=Tenacibaculum sp. P3-BQ1 TaxID=3232310 RepID=UPI0034DE8756
MKNLIIGSLILLSSVSFANDKNTKTPKKHINLTKFEITKKSNKKDKPICQIHYRDLYITSKDGNITKHTMMVIIDCGTGQAR